MSIKRRIISILIVTAIASAVVTGAVWVALMQMMGEVPLLDSRGPMLTVVVISLYLLGGFALIGLLSILLNKNIIVPAVEKTRLENERVMLTEQLHHSQKMEAVGRLAGSIAHDFNNLLTIIDGYASLIVADPKGEDTEESVKEIIEAARKASFITRKLLGFSQKDKTEMVELDLNLAISDTKNMLSRLIGEKTTLVLNPCERPVHVRADSVQLGQVLMNLVVNARDAMPRGGCITIGIEQKEIMTVTPSAHISLCPGSYAVISVADTGEGMDEETIGKIFEAFFTTKASGKGTGLGLSIVKSIMKESNGVIDVESKPGHGTTFFIYLPIIEMEEALLSRQKSENNEPHLSEESALVPDVIEHGPATILLVEDDPMIRGLVAQTLEKKNYRVLLGEEGWEGIKLARNHTGKIDLLFTDVVMPGLSGAELAVATRELYPDIKVLFMSGYSREQLTEEGVPPDASLLEKPFTVERVLSLVAEQLAC